MQAELDTIATARPVRIFGVNAAGQESGNALACDGRVLPWLQDTWQANVWGSWRVSYRDVVILDAENKVLQTYSLTAHDLADPASYAALESILVTAAR